jgi:hypothetical protein
MVRQALKQHFVTGDRFVTTMASLSMVDIGASAAQQAGEEVARRGAVLMAAASQAASAKIGMGNRHSIIAAEAQNAVIAAYTRRYTRNSYRVGDPKRLSGKMMEALTDRSLMISQRDGILMFNEAMLDQKAAHWYRLNFGAQPAGRRKVSKTYKINFEGADLGNLSLRKNRASGRFSLPAGVFISGGKVVAHEKGRRGTDDFYTFGAFYGALGGSGGLDAKKLHKGGLTVGKTKAGRVGFKMETPKDIPTRGIVGGLFFDAGVKVVAKQLPILYSTLLDEWIEKAQTKGKGPVAKVFGITPR